MVQWNHPQAVVVDNNVYIGGGFATPEEDAATVLVFDSLAKVWSTLPRCRNKYFGMAVVNHQLVVVAGIELSGRTKSGLIYRWNQGSQQWELFPSKPMCTPRALLSIVSYDKWLIAVGGEDRDGKVVDSVEKLDHTAEPNECCWSECSKLSTKSTHLSLSVVGNKLFAFCTTTKVPTSTVGMPSNIVFCTSLDDLLSSESTTNPVWQEIRHLPIKAATAVAFNDSLLALGGIEKKTARKVSTCVYKLEYDSTSGHESPSATWKKVGDLPHALYQCASTQLCNSIFLYGKSNEHGTCVYMYTL